MEVTQGFMYWLTRLDGVHTFLAVLTGFMGLLTLCSMIAVMINADAECEMPKWQWLPFKIGSSILVLLCVGTFIPTTKEMAAIIVVPLVVNSEATKQVGHDVLDISGSLGDLAQEWIKELGPEPESQGSD